MIELNRWIGHFDMFWQQNYDEFWKHSKMDLYHSLKPPFCDCENDDFRIIPYKIVLKKYIDWLGGNTDFLDTKQI